MQRGVSGKDQRKQDEAERRQAALLHFQDDRHSRRLLDEQQRVNADAADLEEADAAALEAAEQLPTADGPADSKKDR